MQYETVTLNQEEKQLVKLLLEKVGIVLDQEQLKIAEHLRDKLKTNLSKKF